MLSASEIDRQPLPCIVCGKELTPVWFSPTANKKDLHQPHDAVMFRSSGNYGSTIFDPCDRSEIEINVCDECVVRHQNRIWHIEYVKRPPAVRFSKPFTVPTEVEEES